jgi:mannose-6-phosphate isomerase-like protein (cupin superfamily)
MLKPQVAPRIVRAGEKPVISQSPTDQIWFPLSSADTGNAFSWIEGRVGYLDGPPLHIHVNQDEVLHLLAGELTIVVGDQQDEIRAGDVVFIPRGVAHAYTNLSRTTPAWAIGLHAPGGFDEFMEAFTALPPGPPDPAVMAELGRKYEQAVVGPPLRVTLGLAG